MQFLLPHKSLSFCRRLARLAKIFTGNHIHFARKNKKGGSAASLLPRQSVRRGGIHLTTPTARQLAC